MKGRLKEGQLEALLHDLHGRKASGVLTLEKEPVKKQICFLKGRLRFAASNLREDRLGEFLVRAGVVEAEVIQKAEEQVPLGRRVADLLVSWGFLSAEDLAAWVRAHLLDILVPCFDWKEGQYRFQDGVPNIVGEVASDIPVLECALERSRRRISDAQSKKVLSELGLTPVLTAFVGAEIGRMRFTPAESFILAQADKGAPLSKSIKKAPAGEAEMARATAALIASGVVSLVPPEKGSGEEIYDTLPPGMKGRSQQEADAKAAAAEVRYYRQMHTLLLGADHYKTLGVETSATAEEIRREYYRLAKEIHPDRFLAPPLDVLHKEMEELFTQVLEAYKTLVDPDHRAHYDSERTGGAAPKLAAADQQALARGNFLRGRALFEEGKLAEALSFLQNAVEIDPNRPEFLRLLGTVQARNPRLRRDAEATLLKAIELDPARAEAYLQLGLLYRKLGENEKAVEKLRECLKWEPANLEAGTNLAELTRTVGSRR